MKRRPAVMTLADGIVRVIAVLVAIVLFGLILDTIANLPKIAAFPWNLLGVIPLTLGVCLEILAVNTLWKAGEGTPHPRNPPQRLVTEGPYRYSRNPLYVARLLILLGAALSLGSLGILLLAAILFFVLHFVSLPREERRLQARYGDSWLEYRSRVPRWVSRPRRGAERGSQEPRR